MVATTGKELVSETLRSSLYVLEVAQAAILGWDVGSPGGRNAASRAVWQLVESGELRSIRRRVRNRSLG